MGEGKENMDFKDEKESRIKKIKRNEGGSCGGDEEWKRRKRKRVKVKKGKSNMKHKNGRQGRGQ
jgi:hypothetical protein